MNVIVFGDSIVAGQELIREETPYRDVVYAKLASYYLHAHKLENFAETGTGQFKGQHNLDRLAGWTHSFEGSIEYYKQEVKQAGVALIAYGNNDWKQPNPDGSQHSLTEVKDKLRQNINHIRAINHHIQLVGVIETLAFRKHQPAWHLVGPNGFTYADMVAAYIEVYEEQNVAVFDIRDYHLGNHIDEYVDDRDHFTLAIHKQIAKSLTDFVKHGYQSPVQRFGETDKYIFTGNLFQDSDMRRQLIQKIKTCTQKGKRAEILWFKLQVDEFNNIDEWLVSNDLPTDTKVTNMYQYYAAPLRYDNSMDVLTLKGNQLFNGHNIPFMKFEDDNVSHSFDGEIWSQTMSKKFFADLWLKHYISSKDNLFIWKNNQYELKNDAVV
ncbi:SGNH/GDSL hydrolase family protein [Weissella hellenica]|nr:SGNH/GDSL hydrolase family protein [Weissella hellenica]